MYKSIFVPVDNSEYSNRAIDIAVALGQKFGSEITGCHVYAAKMHDYRFKQMEYTLPGEYLLEDEIERQRRIHDSLITMGLELISDSYLDQVGKKCELANLPLKRRMMDGKHYTEIVKDIKQSKYDLTVIGVLGVGKTKDSTIGTVCENVARKTDKDLLVIKHLPEEGEAERDTILVGVDGSPQSFGAVLTALELAKKFNKKIELIGVYDPYLHYKVFNSIVDVLSEQAAKVFRFEEQNQLHEEIIDCGLAQIYQSHLNVAEKISTELVEGVEISKSLLDGKAFQKILQRAREINPWLLVLGRIGVHSEKDEAGLGGNSENLLRLCSCDILLSTRIEYPELDIKANESILWTPEAESRMERVPATVRGIARTGILRLAIEQGHSVVTNAVIDDAMDRFMPKYSASATQLLAGQLIVEQAKQKTIYMCKKCGTTAAVAKPKLCIVCSNTEFSVLTPEIVEQIITQEGGADTEQTFDGRKLRWTREAREQLLAVEDKYQKRRAKARIEKVARMKKLDTITLEFASAVILDEVGQVLFDVKSDSGNGEKLVSGLKFETYDAESDKKLIRTDSKGNELRSVFAWSLGAAERLQQIPAGFMRDRTQKRAEDIALKEQKQEIDLELLNLAINNSKSAMIEVLLESEALTPDQRQLLAELKEKSPSVVEKQTMAESAASEGESKCPFNALFSQANESPENIADIRAKTKPVSNVYKGVVSQVLNEVGIMSAIAREREDQGIG